MGGNEGSLSPETPKRRKRKQPRKKRQPGVCMCALRGDGRVEARGARAVSLREHKAKERGAANAHTDKFACTKSATFGGRGIFLCFIATSYFT